MTFKVNSFSAKIRHSKTVIFIKLNRFAVFREQLTYEKK